MGAVYNINNDQYEQFMEVNVIDEISNDEHEQLKQKHEKAKNEFIIADLKLQLFAAKKKNAKMLKEKKYYKGQRIQDLRKYKRVKKEPMIEEIPCVDIDSD